MRGISAIIAVILIVAVTVAISIGLALWLLGTTTSVGYGSRPVILGLEGSFEIKSVGIGSQFKTIIVNKGSSTVYVDRIVLDNKHEAMIFQARDTETWENRMVREGRNIHVELRPGESVLVYGLLPGVDIKPGTQHIVSVHTTTGFRLDVPLRVNVNPVSVRDVKAYNLGVRRGDGKWAGVISATIVNHGGRLSDGRLMVYVYGKPDPVSVSPLPPGYDYIDPGETRKIKMYFGIPGNLDIEPDTPLIVELSYKREGSVLREDFAFIVSPPEPIKIYVIYINGTPGSWISPDTVIRYARRIVGEDNVVLIDTIEKLVEFWKNPPDHAIVISCYGESVPGPDKEHDEWGIFDNGHYLNDPSLHDPNTPIYIPVGWRNWFEYMREQISRHGLIYVNPIGIFGWYYVTKPDNPDPYYSHYDWRPQVVNTGTCCGGNGRFHADNRWTGTVISRNGIKVFFNDTRITYTAPSPVHGNATAVWSVLRDMEIMFNISLPEKVENPLDHWGTWSSWRSLNQPAGDYLLYWFYNTSGAVSPNPDEPQEFPYAAAAYRIGNGFLVHNGFPPIGAFRTINPSYDPEEFIAMFAVYSAAYVYVNIYILGEHV